VDTVVFACRACVAVPEMLEDVIPADLGPNQSKLNALTSKSTQVTLTSRIVPPSHNTNSIRPGRKSHQRTRSSGLSEIPCGLFLRFPRAEINCAYDDWDAAPAVHETGSLPLVCWESILVLPGPLEAATFD
jgi:hypothetical protein